MRPEKITYNLTERISRLEKKCILAVEPIKGFQRYLEQSLRISPYGIIFANNIKEALDIIDQKAINLIISEENLPDGDVFSLVRQVRKQGSIAPLILFVAKLTATIRKQAKEVSLAKIYEKPVNMAELDLFIQELLLQPEVLEVLVVDDKIEARRMLEVTIKNIGYKVFAVEDGVAAFNVIKRYQPYLVILDINLPGMDGIAVLRKLKENKISTTVIVTSAYDSEAAIEQCKQLDIEEFIPKPINLRSLRQKVIKIIEEKKLSFLG